MLHVIAGEIVDVMRLDIHCHQFNCHAYVTQVFDWLADHQAQPHM